MRSLIKNLLGPTLCFTTYVLLMFSFKKLGILGFGGNSLKNIVIGGLICAFTLLLVLNFGFIKKRENSK